LNIALFWALLNDKASEIIENFKKYNLSCNLMSQFGAVHHSISLHAIADKNHKV